MKKLFLIALGLVSFNVYANCPGRYFPDTGICQIQGHNGEVVNYNVPPPQSGNSTPPPKKNHLPRRESSFQIRGFGFQ